MKKKRFNWEFCITCDSLVGGRAGPRDGAEGGADSRVGAGSAPGGALILDVRNIVEAERNLEAGGDDAGRVQRRRPRRVETERGRTGDGGGRLAASSWPPPPAVVGRALLALPRTLEPARRALLVLAALFRPLTTPGITSIIIRLFCFTQNIKKYILIWMV